jgi:hypothetical protein
MANSSSRYHISQEVVADMTRELDDARYAVVQALETNHGTIPAAVCGAVQKLLSVVQHLVHVEPFYREHKRLWEEKNGKDSDTTNN